MSGKFRGKALAVILVTVMLSISVSPMIFNNQMGTQPQSSQSGNYPSTIFGSLQEYAQEHGTTVEQLTANWTADDWIRWYKYEGNPSWGSTNITDQFLATDWVKLPNSGNLTWGANYDYEYKYNATSDRLEMWHNGTLVSYLGSDDLWHYASDRPNLTDLHQIVDKQYVDYAVSSLGARYYMVNTSSGISDYKLTQLSPPSGSEQSVTKTGLVDDDYIAGWISPDTSLSKLIKGVYNWYIYAEKTGGTQTLRLYWQLVERKSDDTETVIATSAVSNEISTSKGSYIIPLTLSEDYTLADGSYVVGKLYADVSDGGSAPDIAIYYDGNSKSHWEIPTNLEIFSDQFLKLNGSNANSDIDISPYNLTVGNISASNLKSTASYIIWKDGSTYYALNGSTNEIDYSGTDGNSIIQNAIDDVYADGGGTVYLKRGTYSDVENILLKSGVSIIGEGNEATILQSPSPQTNPIFISDATYVNGITIADLQVKGDSKGSHGIDLHNFNQFIDDCRIDNVVITNCDYGIYGSQDDRTWLLTRCDINNCNTGLYIQNNHPYVYECRFAYCGTGIGGSSITHMPIIGSILERNDIGIDGSNMTSSRIIGCRLTWNNDYDIILHDESLVSSCHFNNAKTQVAAIKILSIHNKIDNCKLEYNSGGSYSKGFIYFATNAPFYSTISNNHLDYCNGDFIYFSIEMSGTASFYSTINNNQLDICTGNFIAIDNINNADIQYCLVISNFIANLKEYFINTSGYNFNHNSIINNWIYFTGDLGSNAVINIPTTYSVYGNIIANNYLVKAGTCGYGMSIDARTSIVSLNRMRGTQIQIVNSNSDSIIKNNIGYTSENSGSSEITGTGSDTSFTISHGLATTPSQVLVTPTNSSMASATWWVSAKSSTTFTITFSTAPSNGDKLSFDWYAEV